MDETTITKIKEQLSPRTRTPEDIKLTKETTVEYDGATLHLTIWGDIRGIYGDVDLVWGNVSGITGDISGISGDVSGLQGCTTGISAKTKEIEEILANG